MHAYIYYTDDVKKFEYDINHLVHASTILLFYSFLLPTILWVTTQCMSMQALLLVEWVCLYGYSLMPYVVACILCVIPLSIISWVALLAATVASCSLIVRN